MSNNMLHIGSKGTEVKKIQAYLGIKNDGDFGEETYAAVVKFQHEHRLKKIDGIVGPETWAAMGMHKKLASLKVPPQPTELQRLLHMDHPSGNDHDANTRNAIRSFQRLKDLDITGIPDPKTLNAIKHSQPMLANLAIERNRVPASDAGHRPLLVIDAGHGEIAGHKIADSGAVVGKIQEADITLSISAMTRDLARARGFDIKMTRDESHQPVASRFLARLEAGNHQETFHLTIHADSAPASHQGTKVYYSKFAEKDSAGYNLAQTLSHGHAQAHNTDLLDPFMLGKTAAALVETGNMNNPTDLARLTSKEGQMQIAREIVDGLAKQYAGMQSESPARLASLQPPAGKAKAKITARV